MNNVPNPAAKAVEAEMTTGLSQRIPIKPGTMLSVRYASDINLSPDGTHAAFVIQEFVSDKPKERARIWLVDTTGGEPKPFSKGPKEDTCPRWSPDSQQLAFTSLGEGEKDKAQLHLISAQGGEARRVCTMPNGVSYLAWSPDGSRIAFLSLEGEEPKSDPKVIGPDRHRRLWTVRPDYDIPEPVTPNNLTVWEYAWSPDGKHIALYYSAGPDETDWYGGQIGIVPANGGAVRQVSQLTRQASALTWSPDGVYITYISGDWSDRGLVGGDIFTLPVEGGDARNLAPGAPFSFSWCRWFPDGRRLLYAGWKSLTHQIGILDAVDGKTTELVDDFVMGDVFVPRLSATPDLHCFAALHATPQHPYDAWFGKLTGEGPVEWQRLTRLNPIAEETFALSPTRRIRYESVDGWQIDAFLTLPLTPKSEGPPPLIVDVHGGPSWAYTENWGYWSQMLASAGFAILQPNIRGSLGQGVAFADAVVHDMGGKDLQDVLHGVDYLIDQKLVDGNRVGIMGWSYGGFMTAWAVTQTTRFKAAMMGAGVSDYHSFHAQSNIPDWDMRFIGVDPLEQPDKYREISAITHAARVTTPTLIVHGENDICVPVNQAYAFYRALRERKVPVELVVYPREGHGFDEKEHVKDLEERMLGWFEKYL
ncbi:MAG TPA: S9 family peptidase [Aggregatilineales bacterium]|nr:S9 family peptidase [Aggregatilineales bacterium]